MSALWISDTSDLFFPITRLPNVIAKDSKNQSFKPITTIIFWFNQSDFLNLQLPQCIMNLDGYQIIDYRHLFIWYSGN